MSCSQIGLLSSRSRSYIEGYSNTNMTVCIISSNQTYFMVHLHNPECPVKKKRGCCIQAQGHWEGSKCQLLFSGLRSQQGSHDQDMAVLFGLLNC